MKPNFESPVHTARDLVERDFTLMIVPGVRTYNDILSKSDIPEYRKIAESIINTKSWSQYNAMTKNEVLSRGTHAMMTSYMAPHELARTTEIDHKFKYKYNFGRGYYRGEILFGDNPISGYLTHKMWHLNEVESLKPKNVII